MTERARLAVVGVGRWGGRLARALLEVEGCRLVALCDIDERRVEALSSSCGAAPFTEAQSMLSEVDLDAVVVATPPHAHFEVAMQAVRAGKHTFVEKPICATVAEATNLVEEARRRGVKLMVGHIERFNEPVGRLKALLESGALGDASLISARRVGPAPPSSVGVVKHLAVHDFDIMRYLVGEPDSVLAWCNRTGTSVAEDSATVLLTFGRATVGRVDVSRLVAERERKLIAVGTKAVAIVDYVGRSLSIVRGESHESHRFEGDPLKLELSHFVECVLTRKEPLVSGVDGLAALKMAESALESVATGTWVRFAG